MTKHCSAAIGIFTLLFAIGVTPQPASAVPIVANGSFETTGSGIPGWTTLTGTPLTFSSGPHGNAEDGTLFLDISGGFSGGTASIQQTISGFDIGQSYTLTYWTSVNRNNNFIDPSGLTATIGSAALTTSFAPASTQPWASPWIFESLSFVASSSTLDLTFASSRTATGSLPAIDNVRISVPESGRTILMMLGALAPLIGLRRKSPAG
jgi:Protein of unknown function (DUF642)